MQRCKSDVKADCIVKLRKFFQTWESEPRIGVYFIEFYPFFAGIIPVCLLVYFNLKIYSDIRERERRRRPVSQRQLAASVRESAPSIVRSQTVALESGFQLDQQTRLTTPQIQVDGPSYAERIKEACMKKITKLSPR